MRDRRQAVGGRAGTQSCLQTYSFVVFVKTIFVQDFFVLLTVIESVLTITTILQGNADHESRAVFVQLLILLL